MQAEGVALVTGASRGLGRATALELARRGFEVVATMRDPAAGTELRAGAEREGLALSVERLDVERPETIRMPDGLRVLVNNAGADARYLPVEEADADEWRHLFAVNVFGLVETTRRAIPVLRRSGGGVICNVTSASLLFPMPFFSAYRASKAAVSALGESLRAELAPFDIRVVEIMPGPIDTDMLAASDRAPEAAAYAPYREMARRAHEGRRSVESQVTAPQDAARAIATTILDDDAPLRSACDPIGHGLLAGWRGQSDEDWMRGLLAGSMLGQESRERSSDARSEG
jgi:NAD(P)-dependent dehydrogenase (short-subunit alcohol dehydrogenase family)